mgnify:CR=1 FL=1|tara:strand:+ start:3021 stop:3263 length:243 start_codon:yes stop_codon:yes gene_type:complete
MSIKLTPNLLRQMVMEERKAILEETNTKSKKTTFVKNKKSIGEKLDYLKRLKIKEADLKNRLRLVEKTRSLLKNKVTKEL